MLEVSWVLAVPWLWVVAWAVEQALVWRVVDHLHVVEPWPWGGAPPRRWHLQHLVRAWGKGAQLWQAHLESVIIIGRGWGVFE